MKSLIIELKTKFTHKDVFLNILVCVVWGNMLLTYLRGIINHIPILGDYTDFMIVLAVILPIVLAIPNLLSKYTVFDFLFCIFMIFAFFFNYAIHPENSTYLNKNIYDCLCIAMPLYFIGAIIDINKYFRILTYVSIICICMCLFYFLHYAQAAKKISEVANDDNMYVAYQALPHVTLLLWNCLRKFNLVYIVTTILGILFLLSCGTRGPLACLGFFGLCYFLFFMNFRHAIIIKIGILSLVSILVMYLQEIISYLTYTFSGFKLSTRILDKIISGELGNDSGRLSLQISLKYYLDTYGNFGGLGYFGAQRFGYQYPHNLILDFQISYGYVIGTILLVLILILCSTALIKSKDNMKRCFIILLISLSIVKFFLSGTFLLDIYFYFLLGYCIRIVINHPNNI